MNHEMRIEETEIATTKNREGLNGLGKQSSKE
jgi:hypothetical protein